MRLRWALSLSVAIGLVAAPAVALVWPDVPERIERGLASPDPLSRRVAAQELRSLGPARGAPLVLKALGDADTEVRIAAAGSAIRLRAPGATEAVLPWLGEREARLRIAACEVARALPNPHAVAQLARALGDADAAVRASAADALGSQASAEAVAPLLGRLDDASPNVRIQIARALARLGDARAVVPLVGKVQDSVSDVRQAVARALGELGDARASQALVLELRDNVDEVRMEALAALGRLHAADAVDAIAPLARDRKPALRQAATAALGRIGSPEAVRTLVLMLGTADDATGIAQRTPVRDALVTAGPQAVPELVRLLENAPAPQAATSAAWVLGELHARDQAPVLVAAMRRGTLPVAAALHALGSLSRGDGPRSAGSAPAQAPAADAASDAVPVVLEFVDDPSPVVRAEALGAAEALLDPGRPDGRAVEPLTAALRNAHLSPAERAKIATLLGRTGAPRAAPVLSSLLAVHDPALRLAAIDALGMLGAGSLGDKPTGGAEDALLDQLSDEDPAVRLHAAVALGDAGGAHARDALLAKLGSGDELDRPAALTALGGVLSRTPSAPALRKVERTLDLAAGPERDALILALGRGASPSASPELARLAASEDADDRASLATVLAAQPGHADAVSLLRALLADASPNVRAQAAWSLGEIGDPTLAGALEPLLAAPDPDAAIDAAAAVGRIASRGHSPELAVRILCPRLDDPRPFVRANALAGLALAGARCGDGAAARRLLLEDGDVVRAAAARSVASPQPSPEDVRALERCAQGDRSGAIARLCHDSLRVPGAAPVPARAHAVEVYVVGETAAAPLPHDAYAIELADGLVRAGHADRRGAVFDPAAPAGDLTLRRAGGAR